MRRVATEAEAQIPGDSPLLPDALRIDRAWFARHMRDFPPARWVRPVLHGVERVPDGPALLVGNHGPLGFDTPLLVHAVYRDVGRIVRPLADSLLFTNPVGRRMARMTASVEARPEHALVLLRAGEWVLVYPGGARETMRGADERYQLSWQGRLGFARVAIEAGAPVVPVACVGTDDLFRQVVDRERMAKTLAGRLTERLLGPAYVPPLYVPRLRRTQFHYTFGEPIATECFAGAGDDGARRLQEQAAASLSALLEQGRKVRRDKLGR